MELANVNHEERNKLVENIRNSWPNFLKESGLLGGGGGNLKSLNPIQPIIEYYEKQAADVFEQNTGRKPTGEELNAFAHAYFSAKLTAEYGQTIAGICGDLKEILAPDNLSYKNQLDMRKDLWNDAIGREIGKGKEGLSDYAIGSLIIDAMKNNRLVLDGSHFLLPEIWSIGDFYRDFLDVIGFALFRKPIYGWVKDDPLVLDLDGDGIETIAMADSQAMFDIDNDKFAERVGWIGKDDGILAIDRNGNIDDISELFGKRDKNGFEELRVMDSNGDGKVDSRDEQFSQLRVWQDKNSNGLVDKGELRGLTEAGVAGINLNYQNTSVNSNGNMITQVSEFTRTDGSQGIAGDVNLQVNQVMTRYNGEFTLDEEVLSMPWLRGYGNVAPLPVAASQNAKVKELVGKLGQETNAANIYTKMDDLLAAWTGTDSIEPGKMRGTSLYY